MDKISKFSSIRALGGLMVWLLTCPVIGYFGEKRSTIFWSRFAWMALEEYPWSPLRRIFHCTHFQFRFLKIPFIGLIKALEKFNLATNLQVFLVYNYLFLLPLLTSFINVCRRKSPSSCEESQVSKHGYSHYSRTPWTCQNVTMHPT